jgi:hypothetical protein
MKILRYSLFCLTLLTGASSCDKDDYDPQLLDFRPDIPVTVTNYTDLRPGFTVRATRPSGTFSFDLEIPASSGRTIKEISKVVAATGVSGLLPSSTAANYITAPIPGNGNKVTFSSSLPTWLTRTGRPSLPPMDPNTKVAELPTQFYLRIVLDDNTTLITEGLRVLVVEP